jgi:ribosome maturation factor RimP
MARGDSPGSRPSGPARDEALRTAVTTLAARAGVDVDGITVRLTGGRRLIRVVVDSDDGVDLDMAASLSRDISTALDTEYDAVLGDDAYTLEVTSRGVGAPLTLPRHFRRSIGRKVSIVLADGSAVGARIARCDDSDLVLLGGPDGVTPMTLPLREVASAKVEVEFSPPPEPVVAALRTLAEPRGEQTASNGDAPGIEGDDAR